MKPETREKTRTIGPRPTRPTEMFWKDGTRFVMNPDGSYSPVAHERYSYERLVSRGDMYRYRISKVNPLSYEVANKITT
jgi:hypothetical protein